MNTKNSLPNGLTLRHRGDSAPALRPVTVSVPGEVLGDLDGVPVAVEVSRRFSGLLYGWDHLIDSTTNTMKENTK